MKSRQDAAAATQGSEQKTVTEGKGRVPEFEGPLKNELPF